MRVSLRRALRQMAVIGLVIGAVLFAINRQMNFPAAGAGILIGMALSPVVWLLYRLVRFVAVTR